MRAVQPNALHAGGRLVVFAKDQPEYNPLPASVDGNGLVMTEWEPSAEDLATLVNGGRVRIWLHTHGQPLQPIGVEVAERAGDPITEEQMS